MKLQEMIDVLEGIDQNDEARTTAEKLLAGAMEHLGQHIIRQHTSGVKTAGECPHRGDMQEVEKSCCGGKTRKLQMWTCAKLGRTVTGTECAACGLPAQAKPARKSCVECVEKHLGAAMVLLAEAQDGYTENRLRAIGHMHEAADESRQWSELSQAIRAARIAYQREGAIPDWEAIALLAKGAHDGQQAAGMAKSSG